MKLLSNASSNPKTTKLLKKFGYEGVIHHMHPNKEVCVWSTPGCRVACLNTSGRGQMWNVQEARKRKTLLWLKNRSDYLTKMRRELMNLDTRAEMKGLWPVARLNGTSDIPWEKYIKLEDEFPDIQFYDYTKSERRIWAWVGTVLLNGVQVSTFPVNYDLTYSYHEQTAPGLVEKFTNRGANVAVVFRNEIPATFQGIDVISGMEHDFRFRDKRGYVVGLLARGRAKHDKTGFVVG